jgi:hypothetical protein
MLSPTPIDDILIRDDIARFWQELAFAVLFPVVGFVVLGFWLEVSSRNGFTPWKRRIAATTVLPVFGFCVISTLYYDYPVMRTLWLGKRVLYTPIFLTIGIVILVVVAWLIYWLRPSQWHKEPW